MAPATTINNSPLTKQIAHRDAGTARQEHSAAMTLPPATVAAVMVTSNLPALMTQGTRIGRHVSALGDSKSLQAEPGWSPRARRRRHVYRWPRARRDWRVRGQATPRRLRGVPDRRASPTAHHRARDRLRAHVSASFGSPCETQLHPRQAHRRGPINDFIGSRDRRADRPSAFRSRPQQYQGNVVATADRDRAGCPIEPDLSAR